MDKPKIGFIVQRCGKEVNGGAEALCLTIAGLMKNYWDVEVLTTCAIDYMTWADEYPAGLGEIDGVAVRRFPVDRPRDVARFNKLSKCVSRRMPHISPDECEGWMQAQGPVSTALFSYLERTSAAYDAYFFFTYLYATSYFGLPLVQEKAVLVPTAHDEWPIHLPMWDNWFRLPRAFAFNTLEERKFLKARFPCHAFGGKVIGVGVDVPCSCSEARFRKRHDVNHEYMLYLGRIDENKGCGELFEYFLEYKKKWRNELKLILAGKAVMSVPSHADIVSLGFVDDQTKYDALAGCRFVVNPSPYESLSIILLEAWALNKPALVSAKSEVLVGQCKRSNAGLWYRNYEEFEACVNYLRTNAGRIGRSAKQFVSENYSWARIRQKYLELLDEVCVTRGAWHNRRFSGR